ncbi:hypothetical protein PsorP6_005001 [Peronosclerospora sorghi]|uniref:Uncharacterized protein n=1 Tax=Peronosclerospora sorghi TaxID=230839 RepID=A0ACC0W7B4_9STRA|nr:hypothetical protein PsorP6_005001 [Peronosclerospora sorghi]
MELTDICCIGHAERLVHCVHALAVSNPHVYEITVEDPQLTFVAFRRLQLRDLIDLKNCIKHDLFCLSPDASIDASGTGRGTSALTSADIHAVQKKLKLTKKHVQICYEARKLTYVARNDEVQLKKFQLEVKKRLFCLHREKLDGMSSADRRKPSWRRSTST